MYLVGSIILYMAIQLKLVVTMYVVYCLSTIEYALSAHTLGAGCKESGGVSARYI